MAACVADPLLQGVGVFDVVRCLVGSGMAVAALARCWCIAKLVSDVDELALHSGVSLSGLVAESLDFEAYLRQ
jgi:hypothetical protein